MNHPQAFAFLTIGIAFIATGATGQRAFVAIGAAFVVLGLVFLAHDRRGGGLR